MEQETTLFMTLLGAFHIFLHRYTNQNDILIGSPIVNRHYPNVSELIGFFVNILPLRANFDENKSFIQVLKEVRQTTLNAYENQDVSFDKIVETLKIKRDTSYHPLIQVMFVLRDPMNCFSIDNVEIERLKIHNPYTMFDLTLIAEPVAEGLMLHFEYADDLFDEKSIITMSQHFERLLKGIVKDPHQQNSKLPLLLDEEIQQQLF